MRIIGLTGGIASGKSTVSSWFESRGCPVIDADKIARDVVLPGKPALQEIIEYFGSSIVDKNQLLHRKALGNIVFQNSQALGVLNGIMHPRIALETDVQLDRLRSEGHESVVHDVPLLFENGLQSRVDIVLLVYVDEATQLRRLMIRDGSSEESALLRVRAQMPLDSKRTLADVVIDNQGSRRDTYLQLEKFWVSWGKNEKEPSKRKKVSRIFATSRSRQKNK